MIEGDTLLDESQYTSLASSLKSAASKPELLLLAVNTPFKDKQLTSMLDLALIEVFIQDEDIISSLAVSDTEYAHGASRLSAKKPKPIRIPVGDSENNIAAAIRTGTVQMVDDWSCLYTPSLTSDESRRKQTAGSVDCSIIVPLSIERGGAVVFSFIQPLSSITKSHKNFTCAYSQLMSVCFEAL